MSNLFEVLKEKTVIVTGSSRGIGKAIALMFGKMKSNVIVNYYNNEEAAIQVKREIEKYGGESFIVRANLMDPEQVKKLVNFAIDEFGTVDILVNNLGDYQRKDFLQLTLDEIDYIMEINFYTTLYAIREALPYMIKQKWGRIINIASTSGVRGSPGAPHYAAAKAAVIGLTKSLAKAYGSQGITVNAVAPGPTDTELLRKWFSEKELEEISKKNPMGKLGKPEDVAEIVVAIAANNHINGQVIVVSGGDV